MSARSSALTMSSSRARVRCQILMFCLLRVIAAVNVLALVGV